VIIVTPYLVRPATTTALRAPTDGFRPASDIERLFLQRFSQGSTASTGNAPTAIGLGGARLSGDAGFIID
jgi:pilus assembly protein CpaC